MEKEFNIFFNYLKKKGLKRTAPREKILRLFLKLERHVSADDLYRHLQKDEKGIGYATVYRTLKLIADCGLASEVDFGDRVKRIEHKFNHRHHDHLICLKCGKFFEVVDPAIERLQERLTHKEKFTPLSHKMEIFGYCCNCKKG